MSKRFTLRMSPVTTTESAFAIENERPPSKVTSLLKSIPIVTCRLSSEPETSEKPSQSADRIVPSSANVHESVEPDKPNPRALASIPSCCASRPAKSCGRQEARRAVDAACRHGVLIENLQHRDDARKAGAEVRHIADAERRHAVAQRGQLREDLVDPNLQEVGKRVGEPAGERDNNGRRLREGRPSAR